MTTDTFKDIEKLESDLWEAADNLRANSIDGAHVRIVGRQSW